MLAMTLEVAAFKPDQIPVLALLGTSEENLRTCRRLATRLGGSDDIRNVQITAEDARQARMGVNSIQTDLRDSDSCRRWIGRKS